MWFSVGLGNRVCVKMSFSRIRYGLQYDKVTERGQCYFQKGSERHCVMELRDFDEMAPRMSKSA